MNKPTWDEAPDWAHWMAMDETGWYHFFANKPELYGRFWIPDHNSDQRIERMPARYDNTGWQDSLEERP